MTATPEEHWTRIPVDSRRWLLYGPRLGRFYMVSPERATDRAFLDLIGLNGEPASSLPDPAQHIAHTLIDLGPSRRDAAPGMLCTAYKLLHRSRHVVPFRLAVGAIARMAARRKSDRSSTEDLGVLARTIHAVEHALSFADCYPRALLSTYLALAAGHRCQVVIGALVPTRKMHAWCVIDGALPYEPAPEHYLYQPLWTCAYSPRPVHAPTT